MIRLTTAATVVLSGLGFAGVASADPPPGEGDQPSCTYSLSPPSVVQVSGNPMVTATLAFPSCTGRILPNERTVCVSAQGSDSAGKCAQSRGSVTAQVFYAPYRPGTVYTSTGSGCATLTGPGNSVCTSLGPQTASL
ncbi:MAG: hypothetical protein QOJ80_2325 [Mycobacterium sp.]|nr:hypothetical protein [Mycobacterium sp.]